MSNSVDPDETALEPSHLDLCCLQKPIIIACDSERVKVTEYVNDYSHFPYECMERKSDLATKRSKVNLRLSFEQTWENESLMLYIKILPQGFLGSGEDFKAVLSYMGMAAILFNSAEPFKQTVFIVLGFNDTSTLEGHFVSSPREREKRDRRESRGDEREGQGRKRNRNESEETEEIKTFPLYPYPLQG